VGDKGSERYDKESGSIECGGGRVEMVKTCTEDEKVSSEIKESMKRDSGKGSG
jgi:hypothetical protein